MAVIWLAISLGAMCGGAVRIIIAHSSIAAGLGLPTATLLANVLGCIAIGTLSGWFAVQAQSSARNVYWQQFWTTGFCGGLTTLSLHSFDAFTLLNSGSTFVLIGYVSSTLVLSLTGLVFARTMIMRGYFQTQPRRKPPQTE